MTEQEIIRESSFYKWFVKRMELAEARGEARGEALAAARHNLNGARKAFLHLLQIRFGDPLPQPVPDRVSAADADTLIRWVGQTSSASTLEEALALPSERRLLRLTLTEQEITRESSFFCEWLVEQVELAEARGEALGEARAEARHQNNGARNPFLKLLRVRFGDPLPQPVLDRVSAADFDTLLRWTGQIVSATTLEETLS